MLGGLESALGVLPEEVRDERNERALRRRARAVLHGPTVRAREAARAGDAATYALALGELAAVEVPKVAGASTGG